jgi:hypothetical protein
MILVAALSGCTLFTDPLKQPVIEDHTDNGWFSKDKMTVFSTTAARREVIVKFPDNKFCAEPPPDVAESLTSSIAVAAQGSAKAQPGSPEFTASIEAVKTLATSIRTLFTRSQGVQLFRDGLFHLCQAYLNHGIKEPEYVALYNDLLKKSLELVEKELPDMKDKRAATAAENAEASAKEAKAAENAATALAQKAKQDADRAEQAAQKAVAKP